MYTVYNRNYKQTLDELTEEFPSSKLLLRVDDTPATEGYLISVSTSPFDNPNFRANIIEGQKYLIWGFYEDGGVLNASIVNDKT